MCENACVCLYVCSYLHERQHPGSLPGPCIAELVQRLSFGLLIPFYSTGIMCYSNPNPIWGVWRWHEDDVMAGTRGETENHRPPRSHKLSMRDRLQLTACLNDYTESLCPQLDRLCREEKLSIVEIRSEKEKSVLTSENINFRKTTLEGLRLYRH